MSQSLPPPRDPLVGQVLGGKFRLIALMDRGGMGKIYRAEQQPLGRPVALKTLDVVDKEGRFQKRFFNEAAALAKLSHPNTVRVIDFGTTDDGVYYFAMEFLNGANLDKVIRTDGPLPPLRVIHIVEQIAGALGEAHAQGIVHRDMKPANVFLTQHGDQSDHVKVIDFGLVKDMAHDAGVSMTGHVLGTPAYMAPEQIDEEDPDARTDLYAVGIILFEALTGVVPFEGKTTMATIMSHLQEPAPRFRDRNPAVDLPASLEWVVARCLEKAPADRFQDMRELAKALRLCAREIRGDLPVPWTPRLVQGKLVIPPALAEADGPPLPSASHGVTRPNRPSKGLSRPVALGMASLGLLTLLGLATLVVVGVGVAGVFAGQQLIEPTDADAAAVPTKPVVIDSIPPGAEVRIDGGTVGYTPHVVEVPEGSLVTVDVKMRAYKRESVELDGSEGKIRLRLIEKTTLKDDP